MLFLIQRSLCWFVWTLVVTVQLIVTGKFLIARTVLFDGEDILASIYIRIENKISSFPDIEQTYLLHILSLSLLLEREDIGIHKFE